MLNPTLRVPALRCLALVPAVPRVRTPRIGLISTLNVRNCVRKVNE